MLKGIAALSVFVVGVLGGHIGGFVATHDLVTLPWELLATLGTAVAASVAWLAMSLLSSHKAHRQTYRELLKQQAEMIREHVATSNKLEAALGRNTEAVHELREDLRRER